LEAGHLPRVIAGKRRITRELETGRIQSAPAANPERAAFLEGFPKRYLRAHSEAEIASHTALEAKARDPKTPRGAAVDVRKVDAAWQLTPAAPDRPGLLYGLASAISSHGANIEVVLIGAEAHKAIDMFYVTADGKKLTPEKDEALAEALREAAG